MHFISYVYGSRYYFPPYKSSCYSLVVFIRYLLRFYYHCDPLIMSLVFFIISHFLKISIRGMHSLFKLNILSFINHTFLILSIIMHRYHLFISSKHYCHAYLVFRICTKINLIWKILTLTVFHFTL